MRPLINRLKVGLPVAVLVVTTLGLAAADTESASANLPPGCGGPETPTGTELYVISATLPADAGSSANGVCIVLPAAGGKNNSARLVANPASCQVKPTVDARANSVSANWGLSNLPKSNCVKPGETVVIQFRAAVAPTGVQADAATWSLAVGDPKSGPVTVTQPVIVDQDDGPKGYKDRFNIPTVVLGKGGGRTFNVKVIHPENAANIQLTGTAPVGNATFEKVAGPARDGATGKFTVFKFKLPASQPIGRYTVMAKGQNMVDSLPWEFFVIFNPGDYVTGNLPFIGNDKSEFQEYLKEHKYGKAEQAALLGCCFGDLNTFRKEILEEALSAAAGKIFAATERRAAANAMRQQLSSSADWIRFNKDARYQTFSYADMLRFLAKIKAARANGVKATAQCMDFERMLLAQLRSVGIAARSVEVARIDKVSGRLNLLNMNVVGVPSYRAWDNHCWVEAALPGQDWQVIDATADEEDPRGHGLGPGYDMDVQQDMVSRETYWRLHFVENAGGESGIELPAQCDNALDDDLDGNVNDGCPKVGAAEAVCNEPEGGAKNDDADKDNFYNDGCPPVGAREANGPCDNASNDDRDPPVKIGNLTNLRINDGCPPVGNNRPGLGHNKEIGVECYDAVDNDNDGKINDGCDAADGGMPGHVVAMDPTKRPFRNLTDEYHKSASTCLVDVDLAVASPVVVGDDSIATLTYTNPQSTAQTVDTDVQLTSPIASQTPGELVSIGQATVSVGPGSSAMQTVSITPASYGTAGIFGVLAFTTDADGAGCAADAGLFVDGPLSLEVMVTPDTVSPGEPFDIAVTLTNITDTLERSGELSIISPTFSPLGDVTAAVPALAPGEVYSQTFTTSVDEPGGPSFLVDSTPSPMMQFARVDVIAPPFLQVINASPVFVPPSGTTLLEADVVNLGEEPLTGVDATLSLSPELTTIDPEIQSLGDLAPGEAKHVAWAVQSGDAGAFPYEIVATAGNTQTVDPATNFDLLAVGSGPVGGTIEMTVAEQAAAAAPGDSRGYDGYAAVAGAAAVLVIAGGGWLLRRRWRAP